MVAQKSTYCQLTILITSCELVPSFGVAREDVHYCTLNGALSIARSRHVSTEREKRCSGEKSLVNISVVSTQVAHHRINTASFLIPCNHTVRHECDLLIEFTPRRSRFSPLAFHTAECHRSRSSCVHGLRANFAFFQVAFFVNRDIKGWVISLSIRCYFTCSS